ncbi:MAG: 2-hydroxyacid dehydrogenase [Candidatus Eremiobacteraeota bacterium]|nr:2-hydroxyacid dehydrogenase [Candidatus Eremiobacteraeota bacterium]
MTRVVALDGIWNDELRARLDPSVEFEVVHPDDKAQRDAVLARASILISVIFDLEIASAAPQLRLLICPAAGTERIDRNALPDYVQLVKARGHEIPIAEHVMGALIALRRHFVAADAALRRGEWIYGFHNAENLLDEVQGSNLGLVGFGRIGREIAVRASAFGIRCAAVTLHPGEHLGEAAMLAWLGGLEHAPEVDKLAAWSDALVLCCELSPLTEGLLHRGRFELMKRTAVVINVARGAIAVERDLYEALRERRIAAAALDVWYNYPHRSQERAAPSNFPFHELDNVLMTPHCSGWTEGNKERRLVWMSQTINEFAARG